MPAKCNVNGCKTNYDSQSASTKEKVMLFKFPSDPKRKEMWLHKISRPGFNPRQGPYICEKHFLQKFIIRSDMYARPDGTIIEIKKHRPKLTKDAYPSLFLPTSVNESQVVRKIREEKLLGIQSGSENKEFDGWIATDQIRDFSSFCNDAKDYLGDRWLCEVDIDRNTQERKCIRFFLKGDITKITNPNFPFIFTVTVSPNMQVKVCSGISGEIPDSSLSWIFGHQSTPVLEYWSQFVTLISQCATGYWVDGNEFNHRVCINDLHELSVEEEDSEILCSLNKALSGCERKSLNLESIDKNAMKDRNEMQRLTLKLYSVVFQRNQLLKKIKNLQALASIDLDVLTLMVNADENPEGKAELGKVYQLVHTIMSEEEIRGGNNNIIPVLMRGFLNLIHKDDSPRKKPSSSYLINTSTTQYKSSILINPSPKSSTLVNTSLTEDESKRRSYDNDGECNQQDEVLGSKAEEMDENDSKDKELLKTVVFKGFVCEICGKKFPKSHSLSLHKRKVHFKGVPIECQVCGERFRCVTRLKQHMLHHTDERNFQCSECGKTFKWKKSFDVHCKYGHTEERPFKCSICAAAFKKKDDVKVHEKIHFRKGKVGMKERYSDFKQAADNLYHCEICGKAFTFAYSLHKHTVCHTEERRYKCTVCQKGFKRRGCFARHQLTHSVETPYECLLCPKKFKMKCTLKAHTKVHEKQELRESMERIQVQNPTYISL